MRKLIILMLMIVGFSSQSQEKFEYTIEGLTEYVVIEFDENTNPYNEVMKWIQYNFKSPEKVIKADLRDEMIRIEGFSQGAICNKSLGVTTCSDALYTIEFNFKENRCRVKPFQLIISQGINKYSVPLDHGKGYHKKNGELRKSNGNVVKEIENLFNNIVESIVNQNTTDDEEW